MNKQPHLTVDASQVAEHVIVCGDPARVNRIATLLTDVVPVAENREFRLMNGRYQGTPMTICSTGIGAPSLMIAVEELVQCGVKAVIRVGSGGALQSGIGLGDLMIAEGAIRDEGGSAAYVKASYPACADFELLSRIEQALKRRGHHYHFGVIRTHDSFYRDDQSQINAFWSQKGVMGSDMETSALLTLGRLRGIKTASILNNVVLFQQDVKEGINQFVDEAEVVMAGEMAGAQVALDALAAME